MMDKSNIKWTTMSDQAIMKSIGLFIKQQRLAQNKTQQQLSHEAGINRATLSLFEKGESSNLATFIQLLRVLNCLQLLELFQVKQQISPLKLAKLEQKERQRARTKITKEKPTTDW